MYKRQDLLADEVLAGAIPDGSTVLIDRKNDNTFMTLLAKQHKPKKDLVGASKNGESSDRAKSPRPDDEGS